MFKNPKLLIATFVVIAAVLMVTPALAAPVTPYEPSGVGTFCNGTGPLVFESSIPDDSWECEAEGTYAVVQPWHSPGGPYNPTYRKDGLSWTQAIAEFDQAGLNSGSIWFVPAKGAAPADAPAAPAADQTLWSRIAGWLWCPGALLLAAPLPLLAFALARRKPAPSKPAAPPPAPPAPK